MSRIGLFTNCIGVFMTVVSGILVFPSNAYSRVTAIEDWIYEEARNGADGLSQNNESGEYHETLSEIPTNKVCTAVQNGDITYYTDCQCKASFNKTCSDGTIGVGEACDGKYVDCKCPDDYVVCEGVEVGVGQSCNINDVEKYASCECPASYKATCNGVGEIGIGIPCKDKYVSCECNSAWVNCANGSGVGSPCVADGDYKYASCAVSEINCDSKYKFVSSNCSEGVAHGNQCNGKYEYCSNVDFVNGPKYTKAIVEQIGENGEAAYAATRYYPENVDASDVNFGQGTWYLPTIKELLQLGYTHSVMKAALTSVSGNAMLSGDFMGGNSYWSSTETNANHAERMSIDCYNGFSMMYSNGKTAKSPVRAVWNCKNCLQKSLSGNDYPQVGDVVYSDMTYDSYEKSHSDKIAVGVVYWALDGMVHIVALKDIGLKSWGLAGVDITGIP